MKGAPARSVWGTVTRPRGVLLAPVLAGVAACATTPNAAPADRPSVQAPREDVLRRCGRRTTPSGTTTFVRTPGVDVLRPRCADVRSCLLGQVTAAETSQPLSRAAVFLEREGTDDDRPIRLQTLTDDQGVFTLVDVPTGHYRIAVYTDARRCEAYGLELGMPGTTMVPVRLPPG